LDKE